MQPPSGFGWMAWTWQTALFWLIVAGLILAMFFWERRDPGGGLRDCLLKLRTTRGDRLFMTLLCAAYVHLIWLALTEIDLLWASALSLALGLFIFRKF